MRTGLEICHNMISNNDYIPSAGSNYRGRSKMKTRNMSLVSPQAARDALKCDFDSSVSCDRKLLRFCFVWMCFVQSVLLHRQKPQNGRKYQH
jgi:hypothetical protein